MSRYNDVLVNFDKALVDNLDGTFSLRTAPGSGTVTGNLVITGNLTVQGNFSFGDLSTDVLTATGTVLLQNDVNLVFGTTNAAGTAVLMQYDTAETNDCFKIGVDETTRRIMILDYGDINTDSALAVETNPTLSIFAASYSAAKRISINHNGTNGVIKAFTGAVNLVANDDTGINVLANANAQLVGSASGYFGFTNSSDGIGISFSPHFTTATASAMFSISNNPFTSANSFAASSSTQVGVSVSFTTNQTSTAAYSALKLAVTETTLGSGTSYLLQLLAGAAGSTEKFSIKNTGFLSSTPSTMLDTVSAWTFTATMPTSTTGRTNGLALTVTGAGSSANIQAASYFTLAAGYTGASYTIAMQADNNSAGTATTYLTGAANIGGLFNATATTTGSNVGFRGNAANGDINAAFAGAATTAKNSATNIGCIAIALNTGTTPVQVGGFFGLMNSAPTLASAALIADNGGTTSDIFLARDNGTAIMTITDGGNVCIGASTAGTSAVKTLVLSNSATAPSDSVDKVHLYSVDLSAGNATLGLWTETAVVTESVTSDRTLSVKINGTTYKICLKV